MRIGIDLGGTSVKAALCADDGAILIKQGVPTKTGDPDGLRADMKQLALALCASGGVQPDEVESIGIGVPGSYDKPSCTLRFGTNLGMNDVCFAETFQPEFGCAVQLDNDANCAALGEATAGAGKNVKNMLMVTLGTGVGGGIIINGKVYSGSNFAGGELGHTVIVVDGRPCTCGRHGCWETYASATGLIKTTKEHMKDAPKDSPIWTIVDGDESKVNGRTAFDAMRAGDPVGKAVVDEYIKYLSVGLTDMINIFQPAILCIGGGICNEGETLLAPVRAFIDREQYAMNSTKKTKVCKAQLGNDAGIIGAALLGKQED